MQKKSTKKICGTFFYYEPESIVFLQGKSVLVSETKCSASQYLLTLKDNEELYELVQLQFDSPRDRKWQNGTYRKDLMYTCEEAKSAVSVFSDTMFAPTSQHRMYLGDKVRLYASEDDFDQPLCKHAATLGFDLVVLTRMVGQEQVLTEVLDTRERDVCLSNLVFT